MKINQDPQWASDSKRDQKKPGIAIKIQQGSLHHTDPMQSAEQSFMAEDGLRIKNANPVGKKDHHRRATRHNKQKNQEGMACYLEEKIK